MLAIFTVVIMMLVLSFFCSISEAALYSVAPARVETLRNKGASSGLRLSMLRERIERPITAILFLNTFANTMGAAVAGALVGAYYAQERVLPFSIALTMIVLVLAEIVPKSLGVGFARSLAPLLAWPIQALVWAFFPLVHAGEWLTRIIVPRHRKRGPEEDEIMALARLGAHYGTILPEEERWIRSMLHLNDHTATDMMTPRPVLTTLVGSRTVSEIEADIPALMHSRIPLTTEEGPDHILGVVLRRKLFDAVVKKQKHRKLEELAGPALFVPATMRGHQLLLNFIEKKTHMAIVMDEYGGTMGVVTLEDVIEVMLGTQIVDEFDLHPDMRAYARSRAKEKMK